MPEWERLAHAAAPVPRVSGLSGPTNARAPATPGGNGSNLESSRERPQRPCRPFFCATRGAAPSRPPRADRDRWQPCPGTGFLGPPHPVPHPPARMAPASCPLDPVTSNARVQGRGKGPPGGPCAAARPAAPASVPQPTGRRAAGTDRGHPSRTSSRQTRGRPPRGRSGSKGHRTGWERTPPRPPSRYREVLAPRPCTGLGNPTATGRTPTRAREQPPTAPRPTHGRAYLPPHKTCLAGSGSRPRLRANNNGERLRRTTLERQPPEDLEPRLPAGGGWVAPHGYPPPGGGRGRSCRTPAGGRIQLP